MTVTVQAPNGDTVDFPDDTPREVMEAAMRARYGGPPSNDNTSTLGSIAEAGRRFVTGAGSELAAVPKFLERVTQSSARALDLPDFMTRGLGTGEPMAATPEEGPLYKTGEALQSVLPTPDKAYDNSLVAKGGGVAGSIAGLLGTYLAAGPAGAALVGGSSAGEQAANIAKAKNATPEQQNEVAFGTAPFGALLSTLPVGRIAGRLGSDAAESVMGAAAKAGVENAAAGGAGQVASNAVAQQVYDPNKPLLEDVPEAALVSGVGGSLVGGGARGAKKVFGAKTAPETAPPPPPEPTLELPAPAPANRPAPLQAAEGPVSEAERAETFRAKAAQATERVQTEKSLTEGGFRKDLEQLKDDNGHPVLTKDGRPIYVAKADENAPPHTLYGEGEKAPRANEDLSPSTNELAARIGEDPAKLASDQLGIPPETFHNLPGDAKERVVLAAQRQRTAETPAKETLRSADEAGRVGEMSATKDVERPLNEGPSSPAAKPSSRPNTEQPTATHVEAGPPKAGKNAEGFQPQQAYAKTSAGGSERPFKASDSAQPEHDALFEQRAAKTTADAKARAEAEAKARYKPNTPTSNTPKGTDAEGNYHVDDQGFVLSDKGSAIKFATQKQAGLWAVNSGNKKSAGQTFEVANHPSGEGFTVWEQTRRQPASPAPPAPEGQSLVPTPRGAAARPIPDGGSPGPQGSGTEGARAESGRPATYPAGAAPSPISKPDLREAPKPRTNDNSEPPTQQSYGHFEEGPATTQREFIRNMDDEHLAGEIKDAFGDLAAAKRGKDIGERPDSLRRYIDDLQSERARRASTQERPDTTPSETKETPKTAGDSNARDESQPAERTDAKAQNDEGSGGPGAEHPERGGQAEEPRRPGKAGEKASQQSSGERGSGTEGQSGRGNSGAGEGQGESVGRDGLTRAEYLARQERYARNNPDEPGLAEAQTLARDGVEGTISKAEALRKIAQMAADGKVLPVTVRIQASRLDATEGEIKNAMDAASGKSNSTFNDLSGTLYSNPFGDPRVWKAMHDMFVGPAKWTVGEASRFVDGLKTDITRFKETLKNTTSLVSWDRVKALGNMLKVVSFGSKEGQLWSLYKRTNLDGLRELHSWIHSDPAGKRAVGGTVAENIQRDASAWSNELRDVLGELTKGRRPSEAATVLDQLGKQIRGGTSRTNTAMGKAAAGVKALLDKVHDRAIAAGMELGKVRENYLPRVLDTSKVLDNRTKFLATAKRAFMADDPAMVPEEAEASAESYLAHIEQQENGVRPGTTDFVRPGGATGGGNSTKGRILSSKAERIFSDAGFYHDNPADALNVYIRRMARDAALTEKLGPDLANWRRIKESIIADPKGMELWAHTHDLMSKMLGFNAPISRVASGISNALRTIGSLTYLSGAAVLHTVQPALTAVRTGRPSDMFRAYGNTLAALTGNAKSDVRLAERLGLVERDLHDYLTETLAQKDVGAVSSKFFKVIGLEPLLKSVSVGAMKTGMHFIGHLADQFAEGGATQTTTTRYLNSLGIAEGDHAGFTKWVRGLKGTPAFDDFQGKYGKMMGLALQRIINQTIMRPTAAYRPLWAEHPFGRFAYSITSYMQSFSTLANERSWTMAKAAASERGLTPQDRLAHLMPAVMLATVVAPLTYGMYELRNALLNKNPDRKEPAPSAGPIDDAWNIADVFSKSSLMGRWDSAYNLMRGMKFDRSAASAVTGPEISGLAQTAVKAVKVLGTDKDASVYAKRELGDDVYRNFVFPAIMAAVVQSSAAASGPLASLGTLGTIFALRNPTVRHMLFTDPVTGTTTEDVKRAGGAHGERPNRAARAERPNRK